MTLPGGHSILVDALSTQRVASGPERGLANPRSGGPPPAGTGAPDHHLQDVRASAPGAHPAATDSGDLATVTAPPVAVANFHAGGHEIRSQLFPRESDREKHLDLRDDCDRGFLDITEEDRS